MSKKYKLVLDVLDDATWRIDVRDARITIGHIFLSPTGVSWKDPNSRDVDAGEIAWADLKGQLLK